MKVSNELPNPALQAEGLEHVAERIAEIVEARSRTWLSPRGDAWPSSSANQDQRHLIAGSVSFDLWTTSPSSSSSNRITSDQPLRVR